MNTEETKQSYVAPGIELYGTRIMEVLCQSITDSGLGSWNYDENEL